APPPQAAAPAVPSFSVPPASQFNVPPPPSHLPQRAGQYAPPDPTIEPRGWFGLAKRFVGFSQESGDQLGSRPERGGDWDIKSLLAAAEERDRGPARPNTAPPASDGYHTSSRHMIETLQAMAIDLDRFLE